MNNYILFKAFLVIGAVMAAAEAYRWGGRGFGGRGYGGRGIGGRGYGGGYRGKRSADAEADAYYGYGGYGGYGYGGIHHYGKRSADAYRGGFRGGFAGRGFGGRGYGGRGRYHGKRSADSDAWVIGGYGGYGGYGYGGVYGYGK